MKIVFFGTGEFAVPTLRALAKVADVKAVYTQPDRPAGRHLKLTSPPVKLEANALDLPLFQPERCTDQEVVSHIQRLKPDAITVAAYGQIIPQSILDIPRLGPINLHASLLPKYRGAAPIHWAIINGEKQTGVSTFFMDAGMDSGPLLLQHAIRIEKDDSVLTVEGKLAQVGSFLMLETLDLLAQERLRAVKQDELLVSKAPKLRKSDGLIDWRKSAEALDCFVRGTYPFPGAFTHNNGHRLKILHATVADKESEGPSGQIVGITKDSILVQTGKGVLTLHEVQPASKPKMNAADYARGYHLSKGDMLES